MAMEIAKAKGAKTVQLVAESYKIGFIGWVNALRDAGRKGGFHHAFLSGPVSIRDHLHRIAYLALQPGSSHLGVREQ